MATKIEIYHKKIGLLDILKEKDEIPFSKVFCKENPQEVLKKLKGKVVIGSYESINFGIEGLMEYNNDSYFYSVHISEAEAPNGMKITKNFSKFDFSWIKNEKPKLDQEYFEDVLKNAITNYLVIKSIKHGYSYMTKRGIQSNDKNITTNYFNNRKIKQNPEKEKELKDICTFASIIHNKTYDAENLEKFYEQNK